MAPIESMAWRASAIRLPANVPTMITPEEQRYLHWLGAHVWSGRGSVVEIGPWLGGSTRCLAAGMKASGHHARGQLQVFDNFIWRSFMADRADLPLSPGESFEPYFRRNTSEYSDIIECHVCALPDEVIGGDAEAGAKRFSEYQTVPLFDGNLGGPVEVLFIDGAKSWRGMRHLLQTLAGSLLPGITLLVCQDFKYWGTYWVPIMMMRLIDHLEPVHNVLGATTLTFRLTRALPGQRLGEFEDHVSSLPTERSLREIEAASELLSRDGDRRGSHDVRLSQVAFLAHQGRIERAVRTFASIERDWPVSVPTTQLDRARRFLTLERGQPLSWPLRLRAAALVWRVASALGRRLRQAG